MTDFALSDALGVMLPLARRLLFLQGVPMMELVIDVARVEGMCTQGSPQDSDSVCQGLTCSDDGQELCRVRWLASH